MQGQGSVFFEKKEKNLSKVLVLGDLFKNSDKMLAVKFDDSSSIFRNYIAEGEN